jgi:hypothetical protein
MPYPSWTCPNCGVNPGSVTSGACACLRVVNHPFADLPPTCPSCEALRSQLAEARREIAEMRADLRADDKEHEHLGAGPYRRMAGRYFDRLDALRAFLDEVKPVLTSGMDNCKYMDETDPDACGCAFCVAARDLLARWPK